MRSSCLLLSVLLLSAAGLELLLLLLLAELLSHLSCLAVDFVLVTDESASWVLVFVCLPLRAGLPLRSSGVGVTLFRFEFLCREANGLSLLLSLLESTDFTVFPGTFSCALESLVPERADGEFATAVTLDGEFR